MSDWRTWVKEDKDATAQVLQAIGARIEEHHQS